LASSSLTAIAAIRLSINSPGLRIGARHAGQRLHDGDVAQHRVRGHPLS
jgi:hypothetical protein